jgi:nicotinamide mononucleotide transporter
LTFFDINNTFVSIFEYPLSYVEFIGTLFGLVSVWLAARDNILTWSTGLINIVFFFAVFYQVQLYSDMFLQVYFFAVSIYGWRTWSRQKRRDERISTLSTQWRIVVSATVLLSAALLGAFMSNIHVLFPKVFPQPAAYPFFDALTTVMSVIATVLLAKRILEHWVLWMLVDMISIILYLKKGILFISLEYVIFLGLASFGLIAWTKTLKNAQRISAG